MDNVERCLLVTILAELQLANAHLACIATGISLNKNSLVNIETQKVMMEACKVRNRALDKLNEVLNMESEETKND